MRILPLPLVGIVMGSQSDWATMKHAASILDDFKIAHETKIVSAHRTPERLYEYAKSAQKRGIKIIIAGAGGSAHLPGMIASLTELPVLGVPIKSRSLNGVDSLLSIVQMPSGIPVGTFAIGESGAKNSAIFAISVLSLSDKELSNKYISWRLDQTNSIEEEPNSLNQIQ
ncbi:MAG: 5-(carboxyamino)imidazole ribonucleotide mutase [Pseudomonadota bacterium]|nr:5-(carboxyamino)imidazole ribonucleotide mutase [Pseudomonadota bacterium]